MAWLIRPSPSVIHDIFNRESILGPVCPLLPQPVSPDASMLTIVGDNRIVARFYDETAFFPSLTFGLPSPLWGKGRVRGRTSLNGKLNIYTPETYGAVSIVEPLQ